MQREAWIKETLDVRRQGKNHHFLQPFLKLEEKYTFPPTLDHIKHGLDTMKSGILSLSSITEFRYPPDQFLASSSKPLATLLRKVLGDPDQSILQSEECRELERQVPTDEMIQSLTGAAICEWVFHSEFRCSAMMSTDIFEEVKQHLSTICECANFKTILIQYQKSD
jgi:hypothetical protein